MNTSQQWPRLAELFDQVIELEPQHRGAFIAEHCGSDPHLRRRLEELLAADAGGETSIGLTMDFADTEVAMPAVSEIPGYEELELVGKGGMGEVYRATRQDRLLGSKSYAIKVLHAHRLNTSGLRRFELERRLLEALDHPNIVRLYEGGELPDRRPYLVMDHVDGVPLDIFCRQHRLPVPARLELFATLCDALQHAHQNRVVHRDIKPNNVLVDLQGVPHLLDFGIAKLMDARSPVTTSLVVPMTPRYASPEQIQGQPVTTASDIYSAGLLLFELLTDQLPTSPQAAVQTEPATLLSSVLPDAYSEIAWARSTTLPRLRRQLKGDLDHIVAKALRQMPGDRYASARELAEDIRCFLSNRPIRARQEEWHDRIRRFTRRHRSAIVVAGLTALTLSATVAAGIQSWRFETAASETLALVRAAADPDEEMLMDRGTLDTVVSSILTMDESKETKASLIVLLSRMSVPDAKLLKQATEMFEAWVLEGQGSRNDAELAHRVGDLLFHGGRFEHSERVLAASVQLAEQSFGPEAAEVIGVLGEPRPCAFRSGAFRAGNRST